jgi:hypothetical protein
MPPDLLSAGPDLLSAGPGSTISWRLPLMPSMIVTVLALAGGVLAAAGSAAGPS